MRAVRFLLSGIGGHNRISYPPAVDRVKCRPAGDALPFVFVVLSGAMNQDGSTPR
jgi:hypothetical protein